MRKKVNEFADSLYKEALDRVWLMRKYHDDVATNPQVRKEYNRVINEYNITPEETSLFHYHYWEGILAAVRYLTENLYDINNVREIDSGILDS